MANSFFFVRQYEPYDHRVQYNDFSNPLRFYYIDFFADSWCVQWNVESRLLNLRSSDREDSRNRLSELSATVTWQMLHSNCFSSKLNKSEIACYVHASNEKRSRPFQKYYQITMRSANCASNRWNTRIRPEISSSCDFHQSMPLLNRWKKKAPTIWSQCVSLRM